MSASVLAIIASVALAAVFAFPGGVAPGTEPARIWSRRRWISAAAGVSVAYVFVDVLPELAALNPVLVGASGKESAPFAEQRIYVLVLLAFIVMYGLQHYVMQSSRTERPSADEGRIDPTYVLQIAGYAAYAALIGYLLVERTEDGPVVLASYTAAMAIHFLIVNHSLGEEHEEAYNRRGRWWLAGSVVAGCLAGLALPLSEIAFARLFAVLAGGVTITSLRAELPDDRQGRFWPFCIGAIVYAAVLMLL
jgi:hypothetical protein